VVSDLVPVAPEMVTFAPLTTAPEESTTLPDRLPRTEDSAEPCAKQWPVTAAIKSSVAAIVVNFFIVSPCRTLATRSGDWMVAIKEQLSDESSGVVTLWTESDSRRTDILLAFLRTVHPVARIY